MRLSIVRPVDEPHTAPATAYETIRVVRDDGVVRLTLDRPERKNAANVVMWRELRHAFDEVADTTTDRVLVITGAGGEFCSGADIVTSGPTDHPVEEMRRVARACLALHDLPKPTIARIDGVAVGAGMNLALACDLTVATTRARFSEIFARRGLAVDFGGSWLLPRLVGLHRAKELVLLAEMFDATEAHRLGLLNRVVEPDEIDGVVDEWVARLLSLPPLALGFSKQLLNDGLSSSLAQALDAEGVAQSVTLAAKDTREAFMAFAEKREPRFEGR
ncbi:MAG: enoyl-CoA hydratase/carnithine racemase [Acidimicrobiales bacterium]|nr:enoyl-CoA hydratase/carnithine racemase [Acidimicrobiales bacterium]